MISIKSKKLPLYEVITKEFLKARIAENLNQHEIAEYIRKTNGGTCSQATVNGYFKKFGLSPDRVTSKLQRGIDIEEVREQYQLLKPYEFTEPIKRIDRETTDFFYEDLVLLISDLQIGALDTDDGFDPVPEETVANYVDTMLTNLLEYINDEDVRVKNMHIFLLGDIVDGEFVYPAQKTINMSSQLRTAIRMVMRIVETCKTFADNVHLYSVHGNHGRVSFKSHRVTNWDNAVADALNIIYEYDPKVHFILENHDTVKIVKIGKWRYLYSHGHLIQGMVDRNKLKAKTQDWYFSIGEFDASLFGHWHTVHLFDINGKPALVNGCAYKSEYIRKQIGGIETLGMVLFRPNENRPIDNIRLLEVE
ncbi:hypothetical protein LCGC14_0729100 [marine sediment metagenome]|uniref:Calcineurin-like phosphoesterase domain-containing protein n=1 Tax=marine sediment metagenome TaxID=412755 RepID=A0A0F9THF5_9ZZZZ